MAKSTENGSVEIERLPDDVARAVAALADRARRVNGPMMRLLNRFGNRAEQWMSSLPAPLRAGFDEMARGLLISLYRGADTAGKNLPSVGENGHKFAAALSGAAGGAAGLASATVELPATVMVMFAAMQRAAKEAGYDPSSDMVRLACLDIFGAGAPGPGDDGINSTFLGSRLWLNSATLQSVVARVLPAFSAMLGRQLAGKAVPIIGAVAGAGINYSFTEYYQEVARVRFGLMRLMEDHGQERIHQAFRAELARNAGQTPPAR
ncbi:MAG: EcsC family protein [Paracoccaceae bacterium]